MVVALRDIAIRGEIRTIVDYVLDMVQVTGGCALGSGGVRVTWGQAWAHVCGFIQAMQRPDRVSTLCSPPSARCFYCTCTTDCPATPPAEP